MTQVDDLVRRMKGGDRRALARLLTRAENVCPELPAVFAAVHRDLGRAHRVGVTGPPGAGKSTLVGRLIEAFRAAGETVGVLAVDPSSPISGGALMADRLRMPASTDPGVFVRSMASRGHPGGLARQSVDVADLIDAFGRDWILIETVGTGQGELEIVSEADTTLVVLHPGAGDAVQAMKSGLFDVGDVFAVNKSDQDGAERLRSELEWAFHLRENRTAPPVVLVSATRDRGVPDLVEALRARRAALETGGGLAVAREARVRLRLRRDVEHRFGFYLDREPAWREQLDVLAARVSRRETDRYSAHRVLARELERRMGVPEGETSP